MSIFDAMYPQCGPDCNCGMLCKRASAIDEHFASRLAFMMECLVVDYHGHWEEACNMLDQYKREWEKVNPSPPTFMGEPMPKDRREKLKDMAEGCKARGAA
jgi:hypothetical protein